MTPPPGPALVALHTLRCTGATPLARLADAARVDPLDLESELIDLGRRGLVVRAEGVWAVTASGKSEDARLVAAELAASGMGGRVAAAFAEFERLNEPVLTVCTDWQLREVGGRRVANDHGDHAWDDRVLRRLAVLDASAQRVCATLTDALARTLRAPSRRSRRPRPLR